MGGTISNPGSTPAVRPLILDMGWRARLAFVVGNDAPSNKSRRPSNFKNRRKMLFSIHLAIIGKTMWICHFYSDEEFQNSFALHSKLQIMTVLSRVVIDILSGRNIKWILKSKAHTIFLLSYAMILKLNSVWRACLGVFFRVFCYWISDFCCWHSKKLS